VLHIHVGSHTDWRGHVDWSGHTDCWSVYTKTLLIFVLPAYLTYLIQPLDFGLFSPLQCYYCDGHDEARATRRTVPKLAAREPLT